MNADRLATIDPEALPALALDSIPAFYRDLSPEARNAKITLNEDLRFSTLTGHRRYLHALEIANAAKHIRELPAPRETLHCIMRGNYNAWDIVPAIQQLAAAPIAHLHVATLGFNAKNCAELLEMLDDGRVHKVTFVCSVFFKTQVADVWEYLHHQLRQRGQTAVAIRSHAKVLALETTDERHYVVESSANLRSCNSIEQFTLTHDRELHAFHGKWIEQVTREALAAPQASAAATPAKPRLAYPQTRAGFGVLAKHRSQDHRHNITRAKQAPPGHAFDRAFTLRAATELAKLIRAWQPQLPAGAIVTAPPQGASAPGPYYARVLARAVARRLKLPYRDTLARTDSKSYHGPHAALAQAPFRAIDAPPFAIVIDDLLTSGATMQRSLEALRAAGSTAFGFAWAGC